MIEVGLILRPRGLKGEVKVECSSEERLRELKTKGEVLFEKNGTQQILKIVNASWQNDFAYLTFEDITTVEAAEELRNGSLLVQKEELKELPEGSYYHFELTGFSVVSTSGKQVGIVTDIIAYPTCDALEVKLATGGQSTFPMIKSMISSIDKSKRQITINEEFLEESWD